MLHACVSKKIISRRREFLQDIIINTFGCRACMGPGWKEAIYLFKKLASRLAITSGKTKSAVLSELTVGSTCIW